MTGWPTRIAVIDHVYTDMAVPYPPHPTIEIRTLNAKLPLMGHTLEWGERPPVTQKTYFLVDLTPYVAFYRRRRLVYEDQ